MNTKPLPIAICLAASGIACVISIYQKVDFSVFLIRFALTALIFYIIGVVFAMVLNHVMKPEEDTEDSSDNASSASNDGAKQDGNSDGAPGQKEKPDDGETKPSS